MSISATKNWLKPPERPEIIDTLISGVGKLHHFLLMKLGSDIP